jgi:GNAT superfamily N-acetyltransferase
MIAMMSLAIRIMRESDVDAAEALYRLAFGTFLKLPEPRAFAGAARKIELRRRTWPDAALVAEKGGALVGVAISSRWGSLGLFGPLAVDPEHWRGGIARQLIEAAMPVYDRWHCRAAALFTFPASMAHVALYQSYDFWTRGLTAIMGRPVTAPSPVPQARSMTALSRAERDEAIAQCAALTDTLYPGMDLRDEIAAVVAHPTADAIILAEGSRIAGFAICHCGKASEADSATVYVKFAAVRSGVAAARDFKRLLDAANDFANRHGATRLDASVNMGCMEAYRLMLAAGFRTVMQGVAMHSPWIEIYDRPDVFALEDWR